MIYSEGDFTLIFAIAGELTGTARGLSGDRLEVADAPDNCLVWACSRHDAADLPGLIAQKNPAAVVLQFCALFNRQIAFTAPGVFSPDNATWISRVEPPGERSGAKAAAVPRRSLFSQNRHQFVGRRRCVCYRPRLTTIARSGKPAIPVQVAWCFILRSNEECSVTCVPNSVERGMSDHEYNIGSYDN